ncbi:GumC family protein [Calothrix sp. NIES-3974]|uniref:GumC family protein n=1 Tax=Calothrix sp. NIES-3974 TaxID=2005462 RepID=UPI000B5EE8EF|nr:polysaccharide biosynthesis tyrosine autokinase [Calothrix sp. NIES-3974]BAZ04962.1 lipopolysaccharide biosynthesis [Calothrix sp. NIES-3974]
MTPPIVKRYAIAFEKYKLIGLASFVLVVAGSVVVAVQPEPAPEYIGDAALTYTGSPIIFSQLGGEVQQSGQTLSQEDLKSEPIIMAIAQKTGQKPQKVFDNLAIRFPKRGADGKLESTIIELKYKDSNGKRVKETLLLLMELAKKYSSDRNTSRVRSIIDKINERLPEVKKDLQQAEQNLERYDKVERPAILAAENGSLLAAVTSSQNQQRQLQQTLIGLSAQIRSLEEKLGLSASEAYVAAALSADPIIASLRSQIFQAESQIELLRRDLRPQHPTMVQLFRQKESAETLLRQRANEVIGGGGTTAPLPASVSGIRMRSNLDPSRQQLANQLVALQTQRETLQQQLANEIRQEEKLRQEYSLVPNKQLERNRLEQQVLLRKAVFDQMQAKLADARTAEAETVGSLDIARPPAVTVEKQAPKSIPVTLGAGGFFGIIVGGGVIFLLGSLEGTYKTHEDIRATLKQRDAVILGELPVIPSDDLPPHLLPTILSPNSPYLEFYEKFRSNIRRTSGNEMKVILITSTGSGEGKTLSAYNLGIACARAGKRTLIIETDLRSPSFAESLHVKPNPQANMEPLRYYGSLSECIHIVPDVENLYIVPSAGPVGQSAAILESSELKRLFADARIRYDMVIVDTKPIGLSNDALLVQQFCDGMILTARPHYTQENLLTEAIDQLMEAELGLLGVIINGADISVNVSPVLDQEMEEKAMKV